MSKSGMHCGFFLKNELLFFGLDIWSFYEYTCIFIQWMHNLCIICNLWNLYTCSLNEFVIKKLMEINMFLFCSQGVYETEWQPAVHLWASEMYPQESADTDDRDGRSSDTKSHGH